MYVGWANNNDMADFDDDSLVIFKKVNVPIYHISIQEMFKGMLVMNFWVECYIFGCMYFYTNCIS